MATIMNPDWLPTLKCSLKVWAARVRSRVQAGGHHYYEQRFYGLAQMLDMVCQRAERGENLTIQAPVGFGITTGLEELAALYRETGQSEIGVASINAIGELHPIDGGDINGLTTIIVDNAQGEFGLGITTQEMIVTRAWLAAFWLNNGAVIRIYPDTVKPPPRLKGHQLTMYQ